MKTPTLRTKLAKFVVWNVGEKWKAWGWWRGGWERWRGWGGRREQSAPKSLWVIRGGLGQDGITSGSSGFGVPFDMRVQRYCTVDGDFELEEGLVFLGRRVGSLDFPAPVVVAETREVAEGFGALVLPIQEHEVVKAIPKERMSERIVEQIQLVLVERIKDRIADQKVDIPVPLVMKEIVAGCAGGGVGATVTCNGSTSNLRRCLFHKLRRTFGEEIVDVTVPPVDAIEAFQLQVCAISNKIQWKCSDMHSGKEEFLTKKYELKMHLNVCSKKIDALRV